MNNNLVLVSGAVVFKKTKRGKVLWFVAKQTDDSEWEIPKVLVRKTESSVRAIMRMMGEKASMTIKVLEEAGRAGGSATVNGKVLPQRHLYYLAISLSSSNEVIGFSEYLWLEYSKAIKKLASKREKLMLRQARKLYRVWEKERQAKKKLLKAKGLDVL